MTDINNMNEEELLSKHRKERKDMQGKIQALKKSAAKGDKKKKKEVAEEIAILELELDKRHAEELSQLKKQDLEVGEICESLQSLETNDAGDVPGQINQRVSKAQRRRDKKATKEREREEYIKVQAKENIHGARNVETQKIKSILKAQNLMIQEIPSDGNCLYSAVDYQLKYVDRSEMGIDRLRSLTSQYLLGHMSDYLPFLSHPESEELMTIEQYEEYCQKVANTAAWGGEVELRALSHAIKCPIEVIQAVGPSIIIGEEYPGKRITITYHRHMYGLGEHYNSVKPYEEPSQEEEIVTNSEEIERHDQITESK
ncbi:deubiquitinase OTUD6B isoform X2 [Anabrus simplex]